MLTVLSDIGLVSSRLMLRGLTSRVHGQQKHAILLPPFAQTAGFAKKKGKDDDSGPDPRITKLLKASHSPPKQCKSSPLFLLSVAHTALFLAAEDT